MTVYYSRDVGRVGRGPHFSIEMRSSQDWVYIETWSYTCLRLSLNMELRRLAFVLKRGATQACIYVETRSYTACICVKRDLEVRILKTNMIFMFSIECDLRVVDEE